MDILLTLPLAELLANFNIVSLYEFTDLTGSLLYRVQLLVYLSLLLFHRFLDNRFDLLLVETFQLVVLLNRYVYFRFLKQMRP